MVQINWTPQARNDLQKIAEYISQDSAKYAKLQVVKILARTQILKNHLFSGKIVKELDQPDVRELIEGNYRIIYRIVHSKRVDILTIHHSARDLSTRNF